MRITSLIAQLAANLESYGNLEVELQDRNTDRSDTIHLAVEKTVDGEEPVLTLRSWPY